MKNKIANTKVECRNAFEQSEHNTKAYTVDDLQEILNVSRNTVYALLRSNKFHSVRIGRQYRISKKEFDYWLSGVKGGS